MPPTQFRPATVVASDFYVDYYDSDDDETHYVIVASVGYCAEDYTEYNVEDIYLVHSIAYSPRCTYEVTSLEVEECDELLDRAHDALQEACDEADREDKKNDELQEARMQA